MPLTLARLAPHRALRWGGIVGLGPLFGTLVLLVLRGPGNLWPVTLLLALLLGTAPAPIGAWVARSFHRRVKAKQAGRTRALGPV